MEILRAILVIFHIVGAGALIGGVLYQVKPLKAGRAVMLPGMLHGALTQLVTGLALVGLALAGGDPFNHVKIAVKSVILVVIFVLILLYWRKEKAPAWAVLGTGALTLANIAIAVAWH